MNTDEIRQKILLDESGELSARDTARLRKCLDSDGEARRYSADTHRMTTMAREALPTGEPSRAVLARIGAAARERSVPRHLFFRPAVQVLAYAAALALVVSGWLVLGPDTRTHADRIVEMHTILEIVTENELPSMEVEGTPEKDAQLAALARQLLIMEGLSGDDLEELEVLPLELPTTDFQSHSTAALPRQKCV